MKQWVYPLFVSARGNILALCGMPVRPTITIELTGKWYGIQLVKPLDATMLDIEELSFEVLEPHRGNGSYFCDHCPNVHAVRAFCEAHEYELDEFAEELMIGRWETEASTNGPYAKWKGSVR